jgi:DNA replication initiation complex subunit (GINS family)
MNVYELIYVAWKRERQTKNLQPLENDFYEKIKPYINHLENQKNNETDSVMVRLFDKRSHRVSYILNDLISIRMEKHFNDAMSGVMSPDELPTEEQQFRTQIEQQQKILRNSALGLESKIEMVEDQEEGYRLMEFTSNENSPFVGSDLITYGPIIKGDFVLLTNDNSRNFMLRSKANEVEINQD